MYAKDLHGNILTSGGYRAEITSRMTVKPPTRQHVPQYARIKEDNRSHKCAECDKLHFEIERLQMQLEERSSRGTRLAMIDTRESGRSGDYRHNNSWEASWADTPDLLSTHNKGENHRQRRQQTDLQEEVKRLKRELHQRTLEVRNLRDLRTQTPTGADVDAMVDPLPVDRVSSMYTDIYQNDWSTANKALQKDKLNHEQAAQKLLTVLIDAFTYCDKVAPQHLEAILKSTIKVKIQGTTNVPSTKGEEADIHQEAGFFRKSIAEKVALNIIKNFRYEVFMRKNTFTPKQKQNIDITSYVDKCVQITWYMAVQNYPIILDDSVSRDKTFEYTHYTSFNEEDEVHGAVYHYLIWPALINAENNVYLCKGVAERSKSF
ncbi:uncharacterized protein LOC127735136 [Mytilus californianus]|uniref:uncharacterized protein LOC127735136 n=1 Tax=Mytilus californianus TaxID=6549 RepID=UPI0022463443|nr:uncharacterized protein LOC127735136 [Mytilus californianus]XP_052101185.1 uncharacterized protein LOC127735136 [Mytilus californianus]